MCGVGIIWYNEQNPGNPIHVRPATLTVVWGITDHTAAVHLRVIPDLIEWTRWDREDAWKKIRRALCTPPVASTVVPRHLRLALILDYLGVRLQRQGWNPSDIAAVCQRAARQFAMGKLQFVLDQDESTVLDVPLEPLMDADNKERQICQ
jgi:hypothetical protein